MRLMQELGILAFCELNYTENEDGTIDLKKSN
jgi:hypothetical protein